MEKETDLKQSGPLVLFNVDRKGRLADYAVCHSDHECGDYLLRQAELALGGAYVPNESVYCLAGAERTDDGLPELLDDYIREGNIRDLPSIDLRSLTFIHETTGGGLPEGMWAILEKTEQLLDSPDNRKILEAYHAYHEKRENALPERTISAVRTDKGVLLFDDSGRGLQCLESYLRYQPDSLVAGLHPSAGCPMHADGEAFRRFVKTFGLNATDEANEIAALTGIRARGLSDPGQLEKVSVHRAGFRNLYERRQASLERNDIVMYRALGQASMDMAERILRTEYKVRGYAPSMAEKETGHRAGPPAGKKKTHRWRKTDGTPKRRV